jgi:hypothetical protein
MGRIYSDADRILAMQKMNPSQRAHEAQRMGNEERAPSQKKALWDMAAKARRDRDSD